MQANSLWRLPDKQRTQTPIKSMRGVQCGEHDMTNRKDERNLHILLVWVLLTPSPVLSPVLRCAEDWPLSKKAASPRRLIIIWQNWDVENKNGLQRISDPGAEASHFFFFFFYLKGTLSHSNVFSPEQSFGVRRRILTFAENKKMRVCAGGNNCLDK